MSITLLHRVLERVKIPREVDSSETAHMNRDTRPLPPSRRPYGPWHFVGFWVVTGASNVGGWTTGSSLIVLGLNVWQLMLTVIIGNCIVGIICVFAGMPGAQWHIGFPIFQRASWGMRGYYFPLSNRILLSFVWFSTHCWWGSQCLKTFFIALWPSYRNLDTLIANGTMNTGDFVIFILFWLICLPQCFVNPERYKIPFIIFSCSVIPTVFILLIYYLVTAGGGGTLLVDAGAVTGIEQATGSHLGWMLVLGITSNIGSMATSLLSQSDYSRFARKPTHQLISQLVMAPLGAIIVALIGIICASCAAQLYPEHATLLWEPYDLLQTLQSHANDSSRSRAAVAFASLAFMVAQFGVCIPANAMSNGIDSSALFPRYFNLTRGALVTCAFGFVIQPWQLLNGANQFLTVIGGYAVFLGPMTGVIDTSIYWYNKGFNWRAVVSWVLGVCLVLPGFIQWITDSSVELSGWSKMYYLAWLVGCAASMTVYTALDRLSPIPQTREIDDEDYFGTFSENSTIINAVNEKRSSLDVQALGLAKKKDQVIPIDIL